jgi:hypothetical protein
MLRVVGDVESIQEWRKSCRNLGAVGRGEWKDSDLVGWVVEKDESKRKTDVLGDSGVDR